MALSLRYEHRKDVVNKKGEHPIILILRVEAQRKKIPTGITLLPEYWDNENQKAIYLNKKSLKEVNKDFDLSLSPLLNDIKRINDDLQDLKKSLEDIAHRYELDNVPYSADMLVEKLKNKNNVKTKKEEKNNIVFDFIDNYVTENEPSRAKGSLSVYKALKSHLGAFEKHNRSRIRFEDINYSFFQSFQNFLIKHRGINNITIAKQLSTLKTFLGYAKMNGIKITDSYRDFKIRKQKLEVIALTGDEFETLYNLDLSKNERLAKVRDVFCFSCVTGLRYSDLAQLRREHIKATEICLTIKKTKEQLIIPINVYAESILEKYNEHLLPIPVISNQKFNDYIKELCELAEINEKIEIIRFKGAIKEATVHPKFDLISAHTGRKTFATLSLEKGIPAETVMGITGHSDYKSFQRYVKVTEERKRNEMNKAWGTPKESIK
ncbi:site-specific integrase [Pedobacter lithocola]|uniref:Site-specific integrase n=1 Tax=Pedobacter lithocola TaxID=1908239 RepID=A0ABV8P9J5_9SPHI